MLRRCWRCKTEKPLEAFAIARKRKHGRTHTCRGCSSEIGKARWQATKADPIKHAIASATSREAAARREGTPKRQDWLKRWRRSRMGFATRLRNSLGITFEQWSDRLLEQAGRCAGCCTQFASAEDACSDHCHVTGAFRGILCAGCNLALGHCGDNPGVLRALAAYLEAAR